MSGRTFVARRPGERAPPLWHWLARQVGETTITPVCKPTIFWFYAEAEAAPPGQGVTCLICLTRRPR